MFTVIQANTEKRFKIKGECIIFLVQDMGLEPIRYCLPEDFKSSMSANSINPAFQLSQLQYIIVYFICQYLYYNLLKFF